ncbi:MAG TPA: carboxypeptidase-like regulatory domain-containing protein [Armatimonadota bacterium]|nr:carboxypeptidase-like regulatory domain-containing protein [Armatimonadota bacterium]
MITDANGSFTVEREHSFSTENTYGAALVTAPGFAINGCVLREGNNIITLEKANTLTLRVFSTDINSKPLSGVRVAMMTFAPGHTEKFALPDSVLRAFTAISDDTGTISFPGVPPSGNVDLYVDDARYEPYSFPIDLSKPGERLWATTGSSVRGRVLAANGRPLSHILVSAGPLPHMTVETDADGVFHIGGLASSLAAKISVTDPDNRWMLTTPSPSVAMKRGEEVVVPDIVLQRGARITVAVRETGTQRPLPFIRMDVWNDVRHTSVEARSDVHGNASIMVQPGTYQVRLSGLSEAYAYDDTPRAVRVRAGDRKTLTFAILKCMQYTGVVQDEQGHPLSNVSLCLQPKTMPDRSVTCITDGQGKFTSPLVPPGGALFMAADVGEASDWEVASPNKTVNTGSPVTVVLRRAPHGRVVSTRGEPIAGVCVAYFLCRPVSHFILNRTFTPYLSTVLTDEHGEYALPVIRPGDMLMITSAVHEGFLLATRGTLHKVNGRLTVNNTVMTASDATVHGQVVDEKGQPVAGASVAALDALPVHRVTTDAQGHFTLTDVLPGAIRLEAAMGNTAVIQPVRTGNAPVQLTLHPVAATAPRDVAHVVAWLQADSALPAGKRIFDHPVALHSLSAVSMVQATAQAKSEGLEITDDMRAASLTVLVKADPAGWGKTVPNALARIGNPLTRCATVLLLGIDLADTDPAIAEQCYGMAQQILRTRKPTEVSPYSPDLLLLAYLLHHRDTGQLMARLQPIVEQGKSRETLGQWYAVVNLLDPSKAVGALTRWCSPQPGAVRAANYLLQRAPRLVESLRPSLRTVELTAMDTDLARMFCELSRDHLSLALECANGIQNVTLRRQALFYISLHQPAETALAFYQECRDTDGVFESLPFTVCAQMAARAYTLDMQLGKELFTRICDPTMPDNGNWTTRDAIAFAYCYSAVNPVDARFLMEQIYAITREVPAMYAPDEFVDYPMVMAAIDPNRALVMLNEMHARGTTGVTISDRVKNLAAAKLLNYMLATPEDRLLMTMK